MSNAVTNGMILDESRDGWSMSCPSCGHVLRYTLLNIAGGREPFLYSEFGSDFVLRDEDAELISRTVGARAPTIDELRKVYTQLEVELAHPTAGRFTRWANVKCSRCGYEFPYNNGVLSEEVRYFDSKIVWMEGAVAYRGDRVPSNRLASVRIKERK